MRRLLFLACAACAFGAAPLAGALGAVGGSLMLVVLGVTMGVAASGEALALAVAGGAIGAFVSALLAPMSSVLAGAMLVGLTYAERSSRIRRPVARAAHVGVALVGGAFAGALAHSYVASSIAVRVVAVVVAAVLAALPLLIDADDAIAHALDGVADVVGDPSRAVLREGAELRRTASEVPIDGAAERQVKKTWASLRRLAEARARLERRRTTASTEAVRKMVDQRIADHVSVLSRAYTATLAASAAKVGIDDAALKSVDLVGEHLEELSDAIVETKG